MLHLIYVYLNIVYSNAVVLPCYYNRLRFSLLYFPWIAIFRSFRIWLHLSITWNIHTVILSYFSFLVIVVLRIIVMFVLFLVTLISIFFTYLCCLRVVLSMYWPYLEYSPFFFLLPFLTHSLPMLSVGCRMHHHDIYCSLAHLVKFFPSPH